METRNLQTEFCKESNELEGVFDWKGRPARKDRHGGMRSTLFVYGMEGFENLAFMAIIINLVTYFTGFMHMEIAESANTLTNFMGTTFLLSLLGGIVSDSCINRFKTSVLTASIELSGYIILLVQAHYDTLKPPPCIAFDPACVKVSGSKAGMLFIGLYLIAIGNGGLKAALPALGADQFDVRDPHERKNIPTYFNMFFFSLSLGAALGVTVVVWVQNNEGWDAGFGISAGAVFISIICIVAGITTYRNRVPGGSPLTRIAQVFVAAFHNRKLTTPEDAHELYESHDNETDVHSEKLLHTSQFKILDKAALLVDNSCQSKKKMEDMSPWHLCSVTQVEETKILIRMIPVFASTIVMNACLAQLQTFSVSQGVTMDRSMGKHFNIPAASVPIISLVFMLILTPLYDRCFVPFARRFTGLEAGITHLQRIGFGLFLSGISMAIAALVEVKRKNVARNNGMLDAIPLLMPPLPISVFWLGFQYFVFGIADLFTFVGLMEFFYSEAPAGMRSLATAFSWTSFSLGYFLSTILVDIVNASTRNITESHGWLRGNNLNRNHLNLFYWLLTILSMLNFFTYLLCSSWYKYKAVVVCQLSDDASAIHHANDPNNSLNKGNGRSHGRGHILV